MAKFQCTCGKSISVPDGWAGKWVKCPGCGEPTNVPGGGSASKKLSSGPKVPARPTDDPDTFLDAIKGLETGSATPSWAQPTSGGNPSGYSYSHAQVDEGMPRPLIYFLAIVGVVGVLALVLTVLLVGGEDDPASTDSTKDSSLAVTPTNIGQDRGTDPNAVSGKDAATKDNTDNGNPVKSGGKNDAKTNADNQVGSPSDNTSQPTNPDVKPPIVTPSDSAVESPPWTFTPQPAPALPLAGEQVATFSASRGEIKRAIVNPYEPASVVAQSSTIEQDPIRRQEFPIRARIEVVYFKGETKRVEIEVPMNSFLLDLRGQVVILLSADQRALSIRRIEFNKLIEVDEVPLYLHEGRVITPTSNQIVYAWLLDKGHLLLANPDARTVSMHKIGERQAQWSHTFKKIRLAKMSPNRQSVVVATDQHVHVINAANGSAQGRLPINPLPAIFASNISFSADGKRMAYSRKIRGYTILTWMWDMSQGQLLGKYGSRDENMNWIGNDRYAVFGHYLYEVDTGVKRWMYKWKSASSPIATPTADRLWYLARHNESQTMLMAFEPINARVNAVLSRPLNRKWYGLVRGSEVDLSLSLPLDATQLASMTQTIKTQLADRQMTWNPDADVLLTYDVKFLPGNFAITYPNPNDPSKKITIREIQIIGKIRIAHKTKQELYYEYRISHRVARPSGISLEEQQANAEMQQLAQRELMTLISDHPLPHSFFNLKEHYRYASHLTDKGIVPEQKAR